MQSLMARMALNQFVVLGRVGMDLYADPPQTRIEDAARYVSAIGGSAGNIAAALARQGSGAMLLSCLPNDAVGRYCQAQLQGYGVGTQYLRMLDAGPARASLAVVETIAQGPNTVLYRNGAADFYLEHSDVARVDFSPIAALVVTGTALAAEPSRSATFAAMARARAAGALVVLDVDYRAYSWANDAEAAQTCLRAAQASDIVVGNDDEFGLLAGEYARGAELAQTLAQSAAQICIYKRGAEGARSFAKGIQFDTPIFKVTAQKPMGAGDGFMGGMLAGLAAGCDLPTAVARGAATAAIIVAGIGCAPASPTTPELNAFIGAHKLT